ncbi:MAG: response regulator [Pseudohongiellaceae bacterium]
MTKISSTPFSNQVLDCPEAHPQAQSRKDTGASEDDAILADLKEQYRHALAEKIQTIKILLNDFREGRMEAIDKLRLIAHSLRGTGTTFGFPEITDAARKVEHADHAEMMPLWPQLMKVLFEVTATGPGASPQRKLLNTEENSASRPHHPGRKKSPPVAATTQSILVAEDDELLASVIRHRLEREDYLVEHFTDGARALQALGTKPFALAILDVKMPVTDGFEVLTRLRAEGGINAGIPVIILTVMGSEKDVVRGYDLGASDFIIKPLAPVELLARVKSLLKVSETIEQ